MEKIGLENCCGGGSVVVPGYLCGGSFFMTGLFTQRCRSTSLL